MVMGKAANLLGDVAIVEFENCGPSRGILAHALQVKLAKVGLGGALLLLLLRGDLRGGGGGGCGGCGRRGGGC